MRNILKIGAVVAISVLVYKKYKAAKEQSPEEKAAKEIAKDIKDKVQDAMRETDISETINKAAERVVNRIKKEASLDRIEKELEDAIVLKVKRALSNAVTSTLFWGS